MEDDRLKNIKEWRKWGPYLSERQWGTVREDCSLDGNCWEDFTHEQAVYRAYRWGEDGLLGISDDQCRLCLSLALWNGKDPILKERLYGLTNDQGNHGEDVKELYYYLDNTPTHSYMKALYKYPQEEFPYKKLAEENAHRTVYDREYELMDTGIFKEKRYFDVLAEYCKASPTDILGRYTITNHGPERASVHVMPTLCYRNIWSWGSCDAKLEWKPTLNKDDDGRIICQHPELGFDQQYTETAEHHRTLETDEADVKEGPSGTNPTMKGKRLKTGTPPSKRKKVETAGPYVFEVDKGQKVEAPEMIFTENDTNSGKWEKKVEKTASEYKKDSFHEYIIRDNKGVVHRRNGTKCAAHYICTLQPGESVVLKVRLHQEILSSSFSDESFDSVFKLRKQEADDFYSKVGKFSPFPDVMRQAYAGLLWNKQFYHLIQKEWSTQKKKGRNQSLITTDPDQPSGSQSLKTKDETKPSGNQSQQTKDPTKTRGSQSQQATGPTETSGSQSQQAADSTKTSGNYEWQHLHCKDIISMPDKWEFPWFAAWDLALQSIPLANIDKEFAMDQLELLLRDGYFHPDGRIPAFEFNFSDTNPPLHAHAVLKVYKKSQDTAFLKRCFTRLQSNFKWWLENKALGDKNIFTGGFLGLDNISVFNRSKPPLKKGFYLAQADATAWMACYALNMMRMSMILATEDITQTEDYQDSAIKYLEHFLAIAEEMNSELWNAEDGFFYDHIISKTSCQSKPLRIKSMVGLIALFASEVLRLSEMRLLPKLQAYMAENEQRLRENVSCSFHANGDIFLSLVSKEQLLKILGYILDKETFLSPYGIRALSKEYQKQPYILKEKDWNDCVDFGSRPSSMVLQPKYSIDYQPGESRCSLFGGNSNWRGPVWLPVNYLLIDSLRRHGDYYGNELKVKFPVSGKQCKGKRPSSKNIVTEQRLALGVIANELALQLQKLFVPGAQNQRPCHGSDVVYSAEPDFKDLCLFYEYFHGDTGRGCGASHQTGWTALICSLMDR